MAYVDNHTPQLLNNDDDIDDEDTDDEEEEEDGQLNVVEEDEDDDDEEEDDLNASFNSHPTTVAPPLPANIPIIVEVLPESMAAKKLTHDQARKLFQRLWTDEDEIGLLQGFLQYSTQRGTSQNNPHDTALFYDQIKTKLQLDFNKNQLVEKLRRLKKKYRNVLARISSGKEVSFKTPHDQATFEIATKIWGTTHTSIDQIQHQNLQRRIDVVVDDDDDDDDDMPPNFNPTTTTTTNLNLNFANNISHHSDKVSDERQSQHKSNKRIRVKMDGAVPTSSSHAQIPIWQPITFEETVKKRISPLLYERSRGRGFVDGIVSPMPLSFASPVNMFGMEAVDDKWRKQQILELEVYSKRLELVQEHIKLTLEQLRSMGS